MGHTSGIIPFDCSFLINGFTLRIVFKRMSEPMNFHQPKIVPQQALLTSQDRQGIDHNVSSARARRN